MKRSVVTLTYNDGQYLVERVTDTTYVLPGQRLDKEAVDALCASKWYKVIINRAITR